MRGVGCGVWGAGCGVGGVGYGVKRLVSEHLCVSGETADGEHGFIFLGNHKSQIVNLVRKSSIANR